MEDSGGFPGGGRGRGRGIRPNRDWTKGSILGSLLGLSLPIMVSQSLNQLGPTIDMVWVGKLGADSIAGVGVSGMIVMLTNSLNMGLFQALRAMVSRSIGAGDEASANHAAQQSLLINIGYSVLMAVVGVFLSEHILRLFGVSPEVVKQGAAYIRIQYIGTVTFAMRNFSEATMQASGDAITPMRIAIFFRLIHLILDPFLIFGWWFFPRLGVSGAALTNIIAQGLGGGIGMWFLFSGLTRLRLSLKGFRFDRQQIWRQVKIGLPASVTGMERTFANLLLVWFVAPFGTVATAAHTMQQRVDNLVQLPVQGFGQGSGVLTGQNLGAGKPERAEKTAWLTVALVTGAMTIVSVLIWFGAEKVVRIFNTEPGLVTVSSTFIRINIVNYLSFGVVQILSQSLNGAGDTLVTMITTMASIWMVQVPLAYFLPHMTHLGVYGVRWAMVIAFSIRGIIYTIYFRSGRWKRTRV